MNIKCSAVPEVQGGGGMQDQDINCSKTKTSTAPSSNYRRGYTLLCGTAGAPLSGPWRGHLTTKSLAPIYRPGWQSQQTLFSSISSISPAQQLGETWGKAFCPHPPVRLLEDFNHRMMTEPEIFRWITLLMFLRHSQVHVHQRHFSSLQWLRMGVCAPST